MLTTGRFGAAGASGHVPAGVKDVLTVLQIAGCRVSAGESARKAS
jgi:hypothetical protein